MSAFARLPRHSRRTLRHDSQATPRATRGGFSLVEMIIAMTIFAIVMAALGGLAVQIGLQGRMGIAGAEKSAAFVEKVNSLATVSYELLPGRSGCTHFADPPYPRTECVTVVNHSANVRRVRVVITPDLGTMRPDTVSFDKTARASVNPFYTP